MAMRGASGAQDKAPQAQAVANTPRGRRDRRSAYRRQAGERGAARCRPVARGAAPAPRVASAPATAYPRAIRLAANRGAILARAAPLADRARAAPLADRTKAVEEATAAAAAKVAVAVGVAAREVVAADLVEPTFLRVVRNSTLPSRRERYPPALTRETVQLIGLRNDGSGSGRPLPSRIAYRRSSWVRGASGVCRIARRQYAAVRCGRTCNTSRRRRRQSRWRPIAPIGERSMRGCEGRRVDQREIRTPPTG